MECGILYLRLYSSILSICFELLQACAIVAPGQGSKWWGDPPSPFPIYIKDCIASRYCFNSCSLVLFR